MTKSKAWTLILAAAVTLGLGACAPASDEAKSRADWYRLIEDSLHPFGRAMERSYKTWVGLDQAPAAETLPDT
ncbi:MAG: hypothetical protein FJX47_21570 [Alphaproteobacteria bacterium]|nr:hypothetical protein [Alphaproteobacteria bacterium]